MSQHHFLIGDVIQRGQATQKLTIRRAVEMVAAIQVNRDATLVSINKIEAEGAEVVVFDLLCDEIAARNKFDIDFVERIALIFYPDTRRLLDTYALRKDFPRGTGHQNHVGLDRPASLCLYSESPASVYRTWTAEKHIAILQRWLEGAATGALHSYDKNPEQFYYVSTLELVLPWDFDEKLGNSDFGLTIKALKHKTLIGEMKRLEKGCTRHAYDMFPLAVRVSPIVGNSIEYPPSNLWELEEQLQRRGASILQQLEAQLRNMIGSGCQSESVPKKSLLVLSIPLRSSTSEEPTRLQRQAFLIDAAPCQIGEALRICFRDVEKPGTYYQEALSAGTVDEVLLRRCLVEPIEVLDQLTVERARLYSGEISSGPHILLAGVGALGATVSSALWAKGWGAWTLVDDDHLKPHNFVRFPVGIHYLGWNKAEAIADVFRTSDPAGTVPVNVFCGDASDTSNIELKKSYEEVDLIVDATTTVDFPRLLSHQAQRARMVSIFVTPSGDDCVLLAEDAIHQYRMDSIEAQYYRFLISSDFGAMHLADKSGAVRTGASCRDISLTLPFNKIAAHSAILSEQIQALPSDRPLARIWRRDLPTGETKLAEIPLTPTRYQQVGQLVVIWDAELEAKVAALRIKNLPNETGGILVGYFDLNVNSIYIVDILAAPLDSISLPLEFERGTEGLAERLQEICIRTFGSVQYLGEWHSHPNGLDALPSEMDFRQAECLAKIMKRDGLPALMLVVGEHEKNFYLCDGSPSRSMTLSSTAVET